MMPLHEVPHTVLWCRYRDDDLLRSSISRSFRQQSSHPSKMLPDRQKRLPATMFPVLFKYIDCTPCSDDVPVTPKDPVTPRATPGVVVPIPTFAWLIRIASVRAPFCSVEKMRELVPALKFWPRSPVIAPVDVPVKRSFALNVMREAVFVADARFERYS